MSVPEQVKKQVEHAKEIRSALEKKDTETPTEELSDTETQVEPDIQPETRSLTEDWEAKYRTLYGKYMAEIPRMNEKIAELEGIIGDLSEKQAGSEVTTDPEYDLDAFAEYGEEFKVLAERNIEAEKTISALTEKVNKMAAELQDTKNDVGSIGEQTAAVTERDFFDDLTKAVPEWEKINARNDWLKWLEEVDQITGSTRQALLDDAKAALNVSRVAAIFKAFSGVKPTAPPISSQVSPQKQGGEAPVTSDKKIWSGADITKFFKDKRDNQFLGREKEAAAMEADIFLAQKEGRIIN